MLFVNHAGHEVPWVAHAAWDGVHLADLVMPCFLLLVGVSVALSLGPRAPGPRRPLLRKVLARTGAPACTELFNGRVHQPWRIYDLPMSCRGSGDVCVKWLMTRRTVYIQYTRMNPAMCSLDSICE